MAISNGVQIGTEVIKTGIKIAENPQIQNLFIKIFHALFSCIKRDEKIVGLYI